ncbi:MAG: hypothetical protein II319_06570 [Clostridia bacterium]|nr:hypothetical protein [Clostridia bacterium]
MSWIFDPAQYEEKEFASIPSGDHRVRISGVEQKKFSSGNDGYEITLDVSGYSSKLWFYLVLDPSDVKKTNQRIGSFFNSFDIGDPDLSHYRNWIGKIGGVRVKMDTYNGEERPKVAFCLARKNQDKLPAWKGEPLATAAPSNYETLSPEDELPFN